MDEDIKKRFETLETTIERLEKNELGLAKEAIEFENKIDAMKAQDKKVWHILYETIIIIMINMKEKPQDKRKLYNDLKKLLEELEKHPKSALIEVKSQLRNEIIKTIEDNVVCGLGMCRGKIKYISKYYYFECQKCGEIHLFFPIANAIPVINKERIEKFGKAMMLVKVENKIDNKKIMNELNKMKDKEDQENILVEETEKEELIIKQHMKQIISHISKLSSKRRQYLAAEIEKDFKNLNPSLKNKIIENLEP